MPVASRLCQPLLRARGRRKAVTKVEASAVAGSTAVTVTATVVEDEAMPQGEETSAPKPAKRARKKEPPLPAVFYSSEMRRSPCQEDALRVISWNVASIRTLLKKDKLALKRLAQEENIDVFCLQETKLQGNAVDKVQEELGLPGWHAFWDCSTARKGYSGTALLSRHKPLKVQMGLGQEDHDAEGRLITAEFAECFVVNVYVPNSGEGLKRLDYRVGAWDGALQNYLAGLAACKHVVVTGDFNCAHQEIDIHNPKTNKRSPGFTVEERESFTCLLERGFVDAWRRQHPGITGYTYWNYRTLARSRNSGWRLDYFLVSEALADAVHDCFHLQDMEGSDHCPVGLTLRLKQPLTPDPATP